MPHKSSIALKAAKVTVVAVAGFLYFITSLFINLLQALNYLVFGKLYNCQDFRRKVNSYLQDIILSQVTIISEWWCGARYRLFFADQETADSFGREHSLVIGNHRYQIDLMLYWLFGEMTSTMGVGKAFTKVELKRMPIFGWSFFFGEFIFLQRNWKEDEKRIGPAIDQLVAHPFPITLLLLPEGTRFTSEKYQAAVKFIEERKIPINLKYHLLPRVKGFAATLGHLQKNHANNFGVYHCQLIARTKPPGEESHMPTLQSLIRGKPFNVDCYIEKIDTSRLPGPDATEAEHSTFLYTVFEKMDKLMEQHLREDSFPKSAIMKVKRPSIFKTLRFVLLNFVFSASLVYLLVYQAIVTHSFYLRLVIYSVIITVTGGLFLIYKRLQYSKYGGTGNKKTSN